MYGSMKQGVFGLLALLTVVASFGPGLREAEAQYFGRNKVQYHDFDFEVLKTEHFDLYYYEGERDAAVETARMAERWYARHSRLLDHELVGRQALIVYESHPHFRQTNALLGQVGEATGGVTEPLKRRVVMPMAGPLKETNHVLGHELVHAFQFSMTGSNPNTPMFRLPGVSQLPLWMVEGMAEYMSKGPRDAHTAMWIRDAMQREDGLPAISDLTNTRKYFPYRFGEALWSYIGGRWGDDKVNQIFRGAARTGSPGRAIHAILGLTPDTLSTFWHEAIRETYEPLREATGAPDEYGEALITEEQGGGTTNIGVSASPDGEWVVYLSEKSLFAIEMYLADAETGEVVRRITKTAVDPHYQSLQFLHSAGAWSEDGRFAFAAVSKGEPVISVIRPEEKGKLQEFRLPRFGEVFNPTWSPDGRRIAFVANDGGVFDLFVLNLEDGELRQLTNDAYAELHPVWSPDGSRIAFATDRFGTDLQQLSFGDYQLAVLDPESTEIRPIPTFDGAKSVNPRWTPDGESLYFVSDRLGISNIYRIRLSTGELRQVTNVYTGISGITALSPVISVSTRSGDLFYGAFEKGNYNIYRSGEESVLAGTELKTLPGDTDYAMLPPAEGRPSSRLVTLLENSDLGLPDPITFARTDYASSLSLDFISQPSLAFAVSSFGTFVGGGASLHFSDMLGYHSLNTVLQLQIRGDQVFNGIGALAGYTNKKNRTNWGLVGGQLPQVFRFFSLSEGSRDIDGDGEEEPVLFQDITNFWIISRQAMGVMEYPFSSVQRVEFSGGFQRTDYVLQTDRDILAAAPGGGVQRVGERDIDHPVCEPGQSFRLELCEPRSINEATVNAALVYDNSITGPTGPVLGQRYRLGVQPYVGTLDYAEVTADYRKYVMPFDGRVTLAGRALHFGRYGGSSDDERLRQLYLGFPSLIRGYDVGSFDLGECRGLDLRECSEFTIIDRLLGTRMAVGNLEARIPVFGPLGTLTTSNVIPPVDFVAFYDAGVMWTDDDPSTELDERAVLVGGDRELITSAGVGFRLNLLGFAIAEIDYVHPFDRPEKGTYWQFSLTPGF